jgi:hypothetical protein
MNAAAHADAVTRQPALDGLPPAATPAVQTPAPPLRPSLEQLLSAGEPVKCCFIGRLAEAALVVPHPEHPEYAGVQVRVQQHVAYHPQACPVLATWHPPRLAGGPAHALAFSTALAATLHAGTEVVVLGIGLEATHHHAEPVLHVLRVLGIRAAQDLASVDAPPAEPDLFRNPA